MLPEIKPIPGFIGYGASRDGQIWTERSQWGAGPEGVYRLMKVQTTRAGYLRAQLMVDGKQKKVAVHRATLAAWVGEIPEGMQINHLNGNKADNNIGNLEVTTAAENSRHAVRTGLRHPRQGEAVTHLVKLTRDQVGIIFDARVMGYKHREIAQMVGTTRANVGAILRGKSWRHLERDIAPQRYSPKQLTDDQVRGVIAKVSGGELQKHVAEELGISRSVVCNIVNGKHWKHLGATA
jgi:plasmid maintenance system antidote protein VapI